MFVVNRAVSLALSGWGYELRVAGGFHPFASIAPAGVTGSCPCPDVTNRVLLSTKHKSVGGSLLNDVAVFAVIVKLTL
jgi:hypothetical protein